MAVVTNHPLYQSTLIWQSKPARRRSQQRIFRGRDFLAAKRRRAERELTNQIGEATIHQRVNAWALPASTFKILPVDLADALEAKYHTASAISSGNTFSFNMERLR